MTGSAILTAIGNVVTASMSWAGDVVTFITSNDLVLYAVVIGFVGLGVGLLGRIFGLRA